MARSQRANIDNLGGGVNDKSRTEINPSESPITLRNVRIDGKGKKPRPGYSTFINDLGTNVPRGLFGWTRSASADDTLALTYNKNMYLANTTDTAWGSPIETSQTVDSKNNYSEYADWMFAFNGTDEMGRLSETAVTFTAVLALGATSGTLTGNWAGTTGVYDVTFSNSEERPVTLTNGATTATWTTPLVAGATADATTIAYDEPATKPASISSASDFTPAFGEVLFGSLVVGGVSGSPNVFYISKPATSAAPENVYDFSGAINAGNADEIKSNSRGTAIKEFAGYGVFWDFNGAGIYKGFVGQPDGTSYLPDIQPIKGADGCVNQKSAVVVGNDIYYLSPKKEIRSLRQGFDESLTALTDPASEKINTWIQNNVDDSFGTDSFGYYDRKNKLVKFHVRAVGSTVPDLVIVGDVENRDENENPSWLIDDGKSFVDGVFFKNMSYTVSSNIGQAFEDEIGLADYDDVSIPTINPTKEYTGGVPTIRKRYKNVNVYGYISNSTSLLATVYVDGVVAAEVTIDSNDVPANSTGGVATESVAVLAVADDDILADYEGLEEFVKRIPMRVSGRKISVVFTTDQINANYYVPYIDYDSIPLSKQNVNISSKL